MKRAFLLVALVLVVGMIAFQILAQTPGNETEEFKIRQGAKAFENVQGTRITDEEPIRLVSDEEVVYCFIIFAVLGSSALYLAYRGQRR